MLILVGMGFTLGNAAGGKLADRSLDGSLLISLSALALVSIALPYLATSHAGAAVGFLLWGVATFATLPPLQMRVMTAAKEAPALASSINVGAFNLGNALGALAGGAVLGGGLSYRAIPVACAVLAVSALVLVLVRRHLSASGTAIVAWSRKRRQPLAGLDRSRRYLARLHDEPLLVKPDGRANKQRKGTHP